MTPRHILLSLSCVFVAWYAFSWGESIGNALTLKYDHDHPELSSDPLQLAERPAFKTAMASWYDSGSRTADGTKMRLDGAWVATRLVPLGSKIEVRYKGKSRIFTVRDKTHVKTGHRLDFPQKTWQSLTGAKLSTGLVPVEWRKL